MSKTIDEKVVSMKFDNSHFESNVKTTMSTLDKLKEKLNLGESAKSFEQINESVKKVDMNPLVKGIEAVNVKFSAMQVVGITALQRLTNATISAGKRMVGTLTRSLVQGGIQRSKNIEQAKFQLKGLGIAWETISDDIDYAVKGTAFGLDSAAKAAAQLSASGTQAGDDMKKALRGISGVAAMTNSSYDEIANVFTRVAGNGRVMAVDLNSLAARGLNAAAALAKAFNTTEAEVRKMTRTGEISFAEFAAAMDNAYGEHAKAANETFEGALSNMKAALSRLGAKIATPGLDNLRDIFNALRATFDNMSNSLDPFIDKINEIQNTVAPKIVSAIEKISYAIATPYKKFTATLQDAGIEITKFESVLKSIWVNMGIEESTIDATLEKYGGSWSDLIRAMGDTEYGEDAVNSIKQALLAMRHEVYDTSLTWDTLSEKIDKAEISESEFNSAMYNTLSGMGYSHAEIASLLKQFHSWEGIVNGMFTKSTDRTDFLNDVLMKLNVTTGSISENIEKLSDAELKNLGLTEEQIKTIRQLGVDAFNANTSIGELIESLVKPSKGQLILQTISNLLTAVKSILTPIKDAFNEIFPKQAIGDITIALEKVQDFTAKLKISDDSINKIKETFMGLFSVVDAVISVFKTLAISIVNVLKHFKGLGNVFLTITAAIGNFLTGMVSGAKTVGLFSSFCNSASDALGRIIDKIKEIASVIKESLITPAMEKFYQVINQLWGITEKAGEGIKNTVKAIAENLDLLATVKLVTIFMFVRDMKLKLDTVFNKAKRLFAIFSKGFDVLNKLAGNIDALSSSLWNFSRNIKYESLIKLAEAVLLLAIAMLLISSVDSKAMASSLSAMAAVIGELIVAIALLDKVFLSPALNKKNITDDKKGISGFFAGIYQLSKAYNYTMMANVIVKMSAVILILATTLKMLSTLKWKELAVGIVGLTGVMALLLSAMFFISKINGASKETIKTVGKMIPMALSLVIIAGALKIIASMEWSELAKGIVGMAAAFLAMTGVIALLALITSKSGNAIKGSSQFITMALALTIMSINLKNIGSMKWEEIAKGIVGLSGMLYSMVGALALLAIINSKTEKGIKSVGSLILLSIALSIMAMNLKNIGSMSWTEIGKGLLGLFASLAMLVSVIAIIGAMSSSAIKSSIAILIMSMSISILSSALISLSNMKLSDLAKGLITLALAFTIVGVAGYLLAPLAAGILALGAAIALIGVGIFAFGAGLVSVSYGLTMLIAAISAGATILVSAVVTIVDSLVAAIPEIIDGVTKIILAIIDVFKKCVPALAEGLWEMILGVVEAGTEYAPKIIDLLADAIINVINSLANRMPDYIQAIKNFIDKLFSSIIDAFKDVTLEDVKTIIETIGLLSAIMLALAALAPLAGQAIIGVVAFGVVLAELTFVLAAVGQLTKIPGLMDFVENGGELLQKVGEAIGKFIGGIAGGIMEGVSETLPETASNLSEFIANLTPFLIGVKIIDDKALSGTLKLAAIMSIIEGLEIEKTITGIFSKKNSLSDFGKELAEFGKYISKYSDEISNIDEKKMDVATSAISSICDLLDAIPSSGGLLKIIKGDNSLSTFADQILSFGKAMADFSNTVAGKINESAVDAAINAGKILAVFYESIPNRGFGDVVSEFVTGGATDASQFSNGITAIGNAIASFSNSVINVDVEHMSMVISELDRLISMYKGLDGFSSSGALSFSSALSSIANLSLDDFKYAFENSSDDIYATMSSLVNTMVSAFSTNEYKIKNAGVKIALKLAEGIESKTEYVKNKMMVLTKKAANRVMTQDIYSAFRNAGKYCVEGFCQGIDENTFKAKAVAAAMAKAAYLAACKELKVKSPSRVFMGVGKYVVDGFAIGIERNTDIVEGASSSMAQTAIDSTKDAMSKLSKVISGEETISRPTISPVLDMSNVYAGNIQLGANINASISRPIDSLSSVVARAQDGINDSNKEVVNAISSLRNDIDDLYSMIDAKSTDVYLDGKRMASAMARPMNRELNNLARRGAY